MDLRTLDPAVVVAIDKQHDELHALLNSLHRRISSAPWCNPMIPSLLQSLVLHLEAHFESEEKGGMYGEIFRIDPSSQPYLDKLVEDHHRMLQKANELANRCHQAPRSTENWQAIQDDYQELRNDLADHELRENSLLGRLPKKLK